MFRWVVWWSDGKLEALRSWLVRAACQPTYDTIVELIELELHVILSFKHSQPNQDRTQE